MNADAIDAVKQHYGSHANNGDTGEALRRRRRGPALPLKIFHNKIKDMLIKRFCFGAEKVLDCCCGRGGDIHKYNTAQVQFLKGIDISSESIHEAQRRLSEYRSSRSPGTRMEFVCSSVLGHGIYDDDNGLYDRVTCFFALHYFMATEKSIENLFLSVSNNLKLGGYFIGTCPDGKRIIQALMTSSDKKKLESPMLTLIPRWTGQYACFGSAFTCSIADTVTEGIHDEGSLEYLVFTTPLKHIGAKYGLKLVTEYAWPDLDTLFDSDDAMTGFKHFHSIFPGSDPSLEQASRLNMAFVFKKVMEIPEGDVQLTLDDVERFDASPPPLSERLSTRGGFSSKRAPIRDDSLPMASNKAPRVENDEKSLSVTKNEKVSDSKKKTSEG